MPTNATTFVDDSGSLYFLPEGAGYISGTEIEGAVAAHYRFTLTSSVAHFGIAGRHANSGSIYYPANNTGSYFTIGSTESGSGETIIPDNIATQFYVYFDTGSSQVGASSLMQYRSPGQINPAYDYGYGKGIATGSRGILVRLKTGMTGTQVASASAEIINANGIAKTEISASYSGSTVLGVGYLDIVQRRPGKLRDSSIFVTGSGISYSVITSGSGVEYQAEYLGTPDFINSSSAILQLNTAAGDKTSFLVSGSGDAKLYFSGSGRVGINTTKPQRELDIHADEIQFQRKAERRGVLLNAEGNFESFDKNEATAATGSEFILKFSRGVAVTQAMLLAVTGDDFDNDTDANTAFNAFPADVQTDILRKAEDIGFMAGANTGDVLGSIRWVAESGSVGDLDSRTTGEAASISAHASDSDNTGVQADLIFKVAGKAGAATQKMLLDANGQHQMTGSLDISNNITVGAAIFHKGDTDTQIGFTDNNLFIKAGNNINFNVSTNTVTVGDGGDVDFQVKASGDQYQIFSDGGNKKVGIGTNTPTYKLTVSGSISSSATVQAEHFYSTDDAVIDGDLDVGGEIECDHLNISDVDDGIHFGDTQVLHVDSDNNVNFGVPSNVAVDLELYGYNHNYTVGRNFTVDAVQNVTIQSEASKISLNGNITASGTISASGNIIANEITSVGNVSAKIDDNGGFLVGTTNALGGNASDNILFLGNNTTWTGITHGRGGATRHTFHGNITASGDISASGDITGVTGSFKYLDIGQYISRSEDPDTFINFTDDDINLSVAGKTAIDITWDGTGGGDTREITFNEGHEDFDVRIEGDTDANLLFTNAGTDKVGIGTNSPGEKLEVVGNISASGEIYSDNIEILAHGSARVSSITNTTDYWGPNFQGPYHTANWNKNVTPESDGNIILERQKANTGFIVPYSCSLVGFDAIGSMNSGENTHFSMSLFTADALTGMNLNISDATAASFTASHATTGISQGNRGYNRHRMTGSCNVTLSPFSVVFPLVKVDAAGNDDSAMSLDMTYVLKIKRIK